MKPVRWLLLGLLLSAVLLAPALPELAAQQKFYCPNAVSVTHIHVQNQRQQYFQQMQQQNAQRMQSLPGGPAFGPR